MIFHLLDSFQLNDEVEGKEEKAIEGIYSFQALINSKLVDCFLKQKKKNWKLGEITFFKFYFKTNIL